MFDDVILSAHWKHGALAEVLVAAADNFFVGRFVKHVYEFVSTLEHLGIKGVEVDAVAVCVLKVSILVLD